MARRRSLGRALDIKTAKRFCCDEFAKGDSVILAFRSEEEDGDSWVDDDGSGWLASLICLRGDIAAGNHRALYLAWLLCAQSGELNDKAVEPPVPQGLGKLSGPLKALANFLRIDHKLIAATARRGRQDKPRAVRELAEQGLSA